VTSTPESNPSAEIRFQGTIASPGVVMGPLITYSRDEAQVRKRRIQASEVPNEIARLDQSLAETRKELQQIRADIASKAGEKQAGVFDAQQLVADDPMLLEAVKSQLASRLLSVDFIYQQMASSFARKLREIPDTYMQERAADIVDVTRRVLKNLQKHSNHENHYMEKPGIIFADDLSPSDTATLDRTKVLGFVTESGSRTSHTAILARSLSLPAVVALDLPDEPWEEGAEAILDGYHGLLIVHPTEQTRQEYELIRSRHHEVEVKLGELRETDAVTLDGHRLIVSANVELPWDLRTEFLFLNRTELPSEEEQVALYRQAARAVAPDGVIIRTLDVGADKQLPHLAIEPEVNPFLGCRGIRHSLVHPAIFRIQLRALCRAGAEGGIGIMFPMISAIGEVRECRRLLAEVQEELKREQLPYAEKIETGIMIEVPSAALIAHHLAREVDFFSIGTNDLTQYTLAVDRSNHRIISLYQPAHPAVLRLIQSSVEAAHQNRIWAGVCGEMASDVLLVPLLVGLGVDSLSLGSASVPRVKRVIQTLNYAEMQVLSRKILAQPDATQNLRVLKELASRLYPEIL
jgi:phosphotransferase system enzyme I (PtsI)